MNDNTLQELFKEIKHNKKFYSDSMDGDHFEQKFRRKLSAYGFSEIIQRSKTDSAVREISDLLQGVHKKEVKKLWDQMKSEILQKNSVEIVSNPFPNVQDVFIFQPFGSQQFPDFLVLTKNKAIAIESKFRKNPSGKIKLNSAKPKWNSNMPKPNAIYLFGVASETITFFIGADIIDYDTRTVLLEFFDELDKNEDKMITSLKDKPNDFGFFPYIRKDYTQKAKESTYKDAKGKKRVAPYFDEIDAEKREQNVIKFFGDLK